MTPRGTDWSLAGLVTILVATGFLTWFAGGESGRWVYATHSVAGAALAILLAWKLRRVVRRILTPSQWDRRTRLGLAALALVVMTLASGWIWTSLGAVYVAGYSLIYWHAVIGVVLALAVGAHLLARAKRPRWRDVAGRRQVLEGAAITVGALIAWQAQRPLAAVLGLPGSERRFTGSYEEDSFAGNAFPTTSWVADDPEPLDQDRYLLRVGGEAGSELEVGIGQLDAGDELTATLDCTGGFYSTQRWRGIWVRTLIDRAGPQRGADHVRFVSVTGYRWSFGLDDAEGLLLATHIGDEPLSHGHGAPLRLVAPTRRGFQWVKWVTEMQITTGPDPGAFPSTILSSYT